MTREEEINKQADKYGSSPYLLRTDNIEGMCGFKAGAKWADKTMKKKVLNFIHTYFYEHPHVNCHICTDSFESLEEMESELIKAMEE